ncbi:MAG: tRNA lysidine(34) synthetase TilS [Spirochaetes bacterium]|nr:tRNA lysidine(34) synthetase TilS [Spirochaetota bacterium]
MKNKNIYNRTFEYITENNLISERDRVLLSMSAGKDSMALLDIFQNLKEKFSIELGIFHLNHMMRGEESDQDEKLLLETAENNQIEIFIRNFDFKTNKNKSYSFEEHARIIRYRFLKDICAQNNFHKIATAHNKDDNVETILMRIFSGTGIHGLAGIDCRRDNIIRPLLFLSSEEIYEHLKIRNIKWREDSSNKDDKYLRNYLRNSVIPVIKSRFESSNESILTLSAIARESIEIINELLNEKQGQLYTLENKEIIIETERYINNKKLFKYIMIKVLKDNFKEFVSEKILEEIYKNTITVCTNGLLYRNPNIIIKKTIRNGKKVIVISRYFNYNCTKSDWEYSIKVTDKDTYDLFVKEINKNFEFEIADHAFFLKNKESENIIFTDFNDCYKNITIRNRRKGDRIQLEYGHKKIKDLMIDNKLDKYHKESVPLLLLNAQIAAYMPGVIDIQANNRVAADFHVRDTSKKVLAIHF